MKDPVIERKISQFRDGSLSFNRGIPIYTEKLIHYQRSSNYAPSIRKAGF